MNTPTYQDKLNELRDVIDAIATQAADVDLSSYHEFCRLVDSADDSATIRTRRAHLLINAAYKIIDTSESPEREAVVAHIQMLRERYDDKEIHNNFVRFTPLGRRLINAIGEWVESDIDALLENSEPFVDDIISLAMEFRNIGAALSGYNILNKLYQLHPDHFETALALTDICADPGIRYASLNMLNLLMDKIFGSTTSQAIKNGVKDCSDQVILNDFIRSFDASESDMENDQRLLTLVGRHFPVAISLANSLSDFYRVAQKIPKKALPCIDGALPLENQLVDAALARLGAPTALALSLLVKSYPHDLPNADDIGIDEIHAAFQEMAQMPIETVSNFIPPAVAHLSNECKRYASLALVSPCPLIEMCQLHASPERVFSNSTSIIAKTLENPSKAELFGLLDVEWWKFSRKPIDGILASWSRVLTNESSDANQVEAVIQQLFRCPDVDAIFERVIDGILKRKDQLPASLRLAAALSAVERNNWEVFAGLLNGFNVRREEFLNETRSRSNSSDNYGGVYWTAKCAPLWDKLFNTVCNWKQYSTIALQALSRCLPEDSYSADRFTENAFVLQALSFSKKGDHEAAYRVVKDCIAQVGEQEAGDISYVLYFLGCKEACKIGDLEAAEFVNNIDRSIEKLSSPIQKNLLNLFIKSSGFDIAPLLFAKLSGASNEEAIATQKQAEEMMRLLESAPESGCSTAFYGANDYATYAAEIIEHYPAHYDIKDPDYRSNPSKAISDLKEFYVSDGTKLFEARLILAIVSKTNAETVLSNARSVSKNQFHLFMLLNDYIHQRHGEILVQLQREADEARIAERNQVIADLSHHIKNLVAKVLDPLQLLQSQIGDKQMGITIQRALRGGALIREIVNAMNLSYRGTAEDYRQDATLAPAGAQPVEALFAHALVSALSNMFDGKYFKRFLDAYFPETQSFVAAKSAFDLMTQQERVSLKNIVDFTETYMCDLDLDIADMSELYLRDKNGSQVKMLIVLNEMLLNTIKYTAEQERGKRFVRFRFHRQDNICSIQVENSCKVRKLASATGLGHVVLENFAKNMGGRCETSNQEGIHRLTFTFADFWKGTT